jgi:diguanylate cyclase (GGDEF)-like protein/PAS domain S-box-containing protein
MANPLRILLVEDNDDDVVLTKLQLRQLAPEIRRVETAEELREALKESWDVVLSDYTLPGFSGPAAYEIYLQHRLEAPFIVVTGTIGEESAVALIKAGVSDFVLKSHLSRLPAVIERELRENEGRRARRRAEAALRESEERYSLALRGANDGLWDWDIQGGRIYYSARWKEMLGYRDHEISNHTHEWESRVHPDEIEIVKAHAVRHFKRESPHFEIEHRMLHKDGGYRWVLTRGLALFNEAGRAYRMAGSQTDIHLRKRAEEQLKHDALHDGLTGLPNRLLFRDLLELMLGRARRDSGFLSAVLFINIERFRFINDSFGHAVGDRMLIELGRRLEEAMKPGDAVARFAGDEFAILLSGIAEPGLAVRTAEQLLKVLSQPLTIDGNEIFPSARIGIVMASPRYAGADDMLRDADTATYRARKSKQRLEMFDQAMHVTAVQQLQLANDLRRAIEAREFVAHFQPIVSVANGTLVGFEALARWQKEGDGIVMPGEFIPMAEEIGLIDAIGNAVLHESCLRMRAWRERSTGIPLTVSVNLSGRQFRHADLSEHVLEIIRSTGADPSSIKFEVTESILIEQPEVVIDTLRRLRALGIKIVLDDFGTGFSSLSYLHRFPLDTLKIDASFVQRMLADQGSAEIVRTIIVLAHNLGMDVVAEGVETAEQLERLAQWGCDYAQGYYFSRPVPAAEASRLIENKRLPEAA